MSIKTFIAEFQDYLFNLEPLFNRLDTKRASKTDYYGAHKNAESLLDEFKVSLDFLESNGVTINQEVEDILKSLNSKLDKIDTFSSAIIGINSSQDNFKELLTIHPYVLNTLPNWESIQKCLVLPITSTYITLTPYTNIVKNGKGLAKFHLESKYASKYLSIDKELSCQLVSISYRNTDKEQLETVTLTNNLNKSNIVLEIPINTAYISIEYYFENVSVLSITPLTFKHSPNNTISLGKQTYDYGNLLVFNSNLDLPKGCYATLELDLSFRDVNNKEVLNTKAQIPLNSDGLLVKKYTKNFEGKVIGYWLNNVYEDYISGSIPEEAYVLYKELSEGSVKLFTESSLKLDVNNSKTIDITASLVFYSLHNTTQTPRLFYLTGMTKNA